MKKLILAFLFTAVIFSCSANDTGVNESKYRFIYNNDGTEILSNRWHGGRALTVEDVYEYVDIVKDAGITTFMICCGSSMPYYDSKYERTLGIPLREEDSFTAPENVVKLGESVRLLKDQGTDIIQLCLERSHRNEMEAFITMRMNDLHFTDTTVTQTALQADFWLEHPEYRMGDYPGWHAYGALNFAHPEVMEYKLNMIKEMCEKYSFDGFELDFMRFLVYFPLGEGRKYLSRMTEFVRKARETIDEKSKRDGKKILLTVRVPPSVELCYEKGFDIRRWIDEGLIDFVTIAAHWIDDPALPVREFRNNLNNPVLPIYASLECGIYDPRVFRTHGDYRGSAAHCWGQGADGLYVFNFFLMEYLLAGQKLDVPDGIFYSDIRTPALLKELGKAEFLEGRNKVYSISDGAEEYGYVQNSPLPIKCEPGKSINIPFSLYEKDAGKSLQQAFLLIRMTGSTDIQADMNGTALKKHTDTLYSFRKKREDEGSRAVFVIPPDLVKYGKNEFIINNTGTGESVLQTFEILVQYGDTDKAGYF